MTKRWAYTDGVWDLMHPNHISVMEEALSHGDNLLIGVVSDAMAASYKRKPIMNENDRLRIISSLRIVSHAFIIDGPLDDGTVIEDVVTRFSPAAVCYAGDGYSQYYKPAEDRGIFVRLSRRPGLSTSEIIANVLKANGIAV